MNSVDESNSIKKINDFVSRHYNMIRECVDYKNEYKNCKSIKGRFHQYFIHGEFLDCDPLKKKSKDCNKCLQNDFESCASVIMAEIILRDERKKNHLANDVWKRRQKPPSNWNEELPEWFAQKYENEYHKKKSECVIF